jgi:hypothetical protein
VNLSIAAAYLALVIPLGPGPTTLDAGIIWSLETHLSVGVGAFATPIGYVMDPRYSAFDVLLREEELLHVWQWEALGPAFALAYALTWGEPFEPYWTRGQRFHNGKHIDYDMSRMWRADARRFPQVRISFGGGEPMSVRVMPGWNVLESRNGSR